MRFGVALAFLALSSCPGPSYTGDVPPPCRDGCVDGLCADSYPVPPPPDGTPRTDFLRELATDCAVDAVDEFSRPIVVTCPAASHRTVAYVGDTSLVRSITTAEGGPNDRTVVVTYEWDNEIRLRTETLESFESDASTTFFQWAWSYDAGIIIRLEEVQRYIVDPRTADPDSDARYVSGGVWRSRDIHDWDVSGQLRQHQMLAGTSDMLIREIDYLWGDGHRFLGATYRWTLTEPQATGDGCRQPTPDVTECDLVLTYDEGGKLVGYVDAGRETVISDNCCGICRD